MAEEDKKLGKLLENQKEQSATTEQIALFDEKQLEALNDIKQTLFAQFKLFREEQLARKRTLDKSQTADDIDVPELLIEAPDKANEFIGAIIGAISGLVAGFVKGITDFVKILAEDSFLAKGAKAIKSGVVTLFERIAAELKILGKFFTEETAVGKLFASAKNNLVKAFEFFVQPLKNAAKMFGEGGKLAELFKPITEFFTKFKGFFKFLGETVGRVLIPLMVAIEGISGFMKGFSGEEGNIMQKIAAGVFDGVTNIVAFFTTDLLDMVVHGFSWIVKKIFGDNPVSEYLSDLNFTKLFKDGMEIIKQAFLHPVDTLKAIGSDLLFWVQKGFQMFDDLMERFYDAILKPLADFFGKFLVDIKNVIVGLFSAIPQFASDMLGIVTFITTGLFDVVKGMVNAVIGFFEPMLGSFGEMASNLFNLVTEGVAKFTSDMVAVVTTIIKVPMKLLSNAVNFVLGKLGFGSDGEGEGDLSEVEGQEDSILKMLTDLLLAPVKLVGSAIIKIVEMLSPSNVLDKVQGVAKIASDMASWISNLASEMWAWVKSKLMFWKKSEQAEEPLTGNESVQDLVEEGVVKNTGKYDPRTAKIDDSKIDQLSGEQLDAISAEYPSYDALQRQIQEEKARRAGPQKSPGSMATAVASPVSVAEVESVYADPMAVISGTGQEVGAAGTDLVVSQATMEENKSQASSGGGGGMGPIIAPSVVNNSSTSVTNVSSRPPSTRDHSDQLPIFRAAGNPR